MSTQSIRSYKSVQSLLSSISPGKMRGKSTSRNFENSNYNFDDTVPIEIKVHPGESISTERQISVLTKPKSSLNKTKHFGSISDLEIANNKLYMKSIQAKIAECKYFVLTGLRVRKELLYAIII